MDKLDCLALGFQTGTQPNEAGAQWKPKELVNLEGDKIWVLCAEDHLRFLCLHLLKHGAWRPFWLCDVGMALESRSSNFDWDRCFGENKRRAEWIAPGLSTDNPSYLTIIA